MANWSTLREALALINDRVTFTWSELDDLVGGLPRSAYEHAAFWKGARSGWPGFTTEGVRVGESVTFVRRSTHLAPATRRPAKITPRRPSGNTTRVDAVLVGCVKSKLDRPAPARDLYTSPLFRKARSYAEMTGAPWFVLSAEHGLVTSSTVLRPYDLRLSNAPRDYRRTWGLRVVEQLQDAVGPLPEKIIEVHAGSAYADAIRDRLVAEGAEVVEPLRGMTMGARLAWYDHNDAAQNSVPEVPELVEQLGKPESAVTPADFLATGGTGLRRPGLYSWWVDHEGAATLTAGLQHIVHPGLIYAGLAGATRARSGRKSTNTLWGRIRGMHLGGRHEFSTFRFSLGAILATARNEPEIDEERLTVWMHQHIRLIAIPIDDADALNGLESAVLAALNPPLNLDKMPRSPIRQRLTDLRRQHSRRSRSRQ